ncbi:MAG: LacI family DNA-binding transcriptional regulator [Ignavibacteriaceae bacterium]
MPDQINFNDPAPLYEQIERAIKRKIKMGEFQPGDPVGSQNDLSKEFKVSIITVKKALSDLVNEGILFTRVGKGTYVSDQPQRKLDISQHKAIGLVLRDIKHPFFAMVVHGIEERAYELGYNILLSSSSNKIEKEENQINHFRELGVDGLIIASLSLEYRATDYIQKIHNENFPYIMVSYMHDPDYWYVGSDQELGGFIATEHLIKTGYKSIGYVHIGKGNLLSEVRKNGYTRALNEYNISFNSKLIFFLGTENFDSGSDRYQLGYDFGKTLKSLDKKPDALFLYSDLAALGFEQAALEEGISIPDDVAIVGFDDLEVARFASVPLTTINQSAENIGRKAVDIIQKRINGSDIGNRTIIKPSLIIRESCGAKRKAAGNLIKLREAQL